MRMPVGYREETATANVVPGALSGGSTRNVRWRFFCCVSRNLLWLTGVQCAFRAKPIFGGRSDWAASVHPELIGKNRRLLLLFMIFHKFLSEHPSSSKSKTTGDPDRSISAWPDPGTQVETRRSDESSLRSVQSSALPIAGF
jgi:hypothetical protein